MSEQVESPTVAVTAPTAAQAPTVIHSLSAEDITAARELVLKANPNAIPELVQGSTLAELSSSANAATEAYNRILSNINGVNATPPVVPIAPIVPAGGAATPLDLSTLPAVELIKRGIAARRAQLS